MEGVVLKRLASPYRPGVPVDGLAQGEVSGLGCVRGAEVPGPDTGTSRARCPHHGPGTHPRTYEAPNRLVGLPARPPGGEQRDAVPVCTGSAGR